jgi:hypothetical protein
MSHAVLYVAGPYSHPDPAVRQERFEALTRHSAELVEAGFIVHSPITLTHSLELAMSGPRLGSFWLDFDEPFMEMCTSLCVVKLPGWEESTGVAREIATFTAAGKPIIYRPA